MAMTIEAIFDGLVLRPEEPLDLEEGTRVRITVEAVPSTAADRPRSFLQTARSLQLEGPPDWSANLDQCLHGQEPLQEPGFHER